MAVPAAMVVVLCDDTGIGENVCDDFIFAPDITHVAAFVFVVAAVVADAVATAVAAVALLLLLYVAFAAVVLL